MIANAWESFYITPADVTHLSRRFEICFSLHTYKPLVSHAKKQIILKVIDGKRWDGWETKMHCNLLLIIFSLLVHNGDKVCPCLSSSQLRCILSKTRCLEMFLHVHKTSLNSDKMCCLYRTFASCFSLYRLALLNITSPKLHLLVTLLHLLKDCLVRMVNSAHVLAITI